MEISSLLNSLLGRPSQAQPEAPVEVTDVSQAKPGTRLAATVERVIDISATQKQTLLERFNQELGQLKSAQNPPAQAGNLPSSATKSAGTAPSSISSARQALANLAKLELLTSPKLLLADLKLLQNTHLIYTNRPLTAGQQIQVQVRADGQLLLLDPPATSAQAKITEPGAVAAAKNASIQPANHFASREAAELIAQGLRRYLPHDNSSVELFKTIAKLVDLTKTVPDTTKPALLPEPAWKALAQLNQKPLAPEQLQKPEVLQQVLKGSGHYFESTLAQVVRNAPRAGTSASASPGTEAKTAETSPALADKNIQPLIERDQKALLLSLVKELAQPPQPHPATGTTLKSPAPDLFSLFTVLFNQLGRGLKARQDPAQNQQQLAALLKTQVATSLARIQTQQLQQLNHAAADNLTAPTGGTFEIPVKINENIFPLFIHLQERPVKEKSGEDEKKDKKDNSRKKSRRWQVFMEFDLDDLGWFASEINVIDNKVKTHFWAENTNTRNSARQKLDELKEKLKQNGIDVEELRCLEGEPPKRPTGIKQTLVDITT